MLEHVSFTVDGWTELWHDPTDRGWNNAGGDGLGLYFFNLPPDIPVALNDLDGLRQSYRHQFADSGGGLIELIVLNIDTLPAIKLIAKVPQASNGMMYLGSITLPRRDFSYVIKFQCPERGPTGLREAIVMDQALAHQRVTIDEAGQLKGWAADPYDPSFSGGVLRNRAEAEEYDKEFPDHPLSRVRRYLNAVVPTIRLSERTKRAPAFGEPAALGPNKPWWKCW
jgi:hypothetical protein